MEIAHLPYNRINKDKWDKCISESRNSLIYARSVYLDHMSNHWDGLILGDYDAVMPLTWKIKWGIKYLYQPAFIQQGGVFSRLEIDKEMSDAFIRKAFREFSFAEITLNHGMELPDNVNFQLRNNYIIDLSSHSAFTPKVRSIVSAAENLMLQYLPEDNIKETIGHYATLYKERLPFFTTRDFNNFKALCCALPASNVVIRKVIKDDTILASALLLRDEHRLYNVVSNITNEGRKLNANYFLYAELIKEFRETGLTLDFEGSDIEGIAFFYSRFASMNEQYPFVKMNRLPALIKLFKK